MLASRVRMATFKDSLFIPEGYVLATEPEPDKIEILN